MENEARQLAQMRRIAPGTRLRSDLSKWATTTIALQGGRLVSESLHPDAHKVWRFGQVHRQELTDAVRYEAVGATVRMFAGSDVRVLPADTTEGLELWVVSAPPLASGGDDPRRLTHGVALFDYLVDATPIIAECPDAEGGGRRKTQLPCGAPLVASLRSLAASPLASFPEFCYSAYFESA